MTILLVSVAVVVSVVGVYLFLRNNPRKKAAIDREIEKLKKELDI